MELNALVGKFNEVNIRLQKAIGDHCDADEIRSLDAELSETLFEIREYQPLSIGELKQKLKFFIDEVTFEHQGGSHSFALNSIVTMLETDFDEEFLAKIFGLKDRVIRQECSAPTNAFDLVAASNDRISIIDRNYRYVNTSHKNGQFYNAAPDAVAGKHVSEMIGRDRFEKRARKFLDCCFSGSRQQYFHTLEVNRETRIMSCHMVPLTHDDNQAHHALVAINDVTKLVVNPESVVLEAI